MRLLLVNALLLTCGLALSGCASTLHVDQPKVLSVEAPAAKLAPAPASVMVPRKADFQERMLNWCCESPAKPTK